MLSRQATLGVSLIIAALLYEFYCPQSARQDQRRRALAAKLAEAWEREIHRPSHMPQRIAVGVNSNLDLIVSATELLRALHISPGAAVTHPHLSSLRDLQELVAYSMQHCAGTERFFTSQEVFEQTVQAATMVTHSYHIGGNAGLIAETIQQSEPDTQVLLVGPMGRKLKELLHPKLETPTFTAESQDEVHMILEYPKGERWGAIQSSCANRVIYSHDVSNSKLVALESFEKILKTFRPDLIVLSGAHLLDGQPEVIWRSRLQDIAALLDSIPPSTPVHWELATVGNLQYFYHLADTIFPRIDSLGLNEQELVSVAKAANASFDFSKIPSKPAIETVSDILHWLIQKYGAEGRRSSRLTRVHFHSLTFHILASLKQGPWGNSHVAVMAGTRVAGLQACDMQYFKPAKFELQIPLDFTLSQMDPVLSHTEIHFSHVDSPVMWSREGMRYFLSPVLVCKQPLKTVGLGDAISASGLMHSEFRATS